jgi:DNA sulfur modification protein DndC
VPDLTPAELDRHLIEHAISDSQMRGVEGQHMHLFPLAA